MLHASRPLIVGFPFSLAVASNKVFKMRGHLSRCSLFHTNIHEVARERCGPSSMLTLVSDDRPLHLGSRRAARANLRCFIEGHEWRPNCLCSIGAQRSRGDGGTKMNQGCW